MIKDGDCMRCSACGCDNVAVIAITWHENGGVRVDVSKQEEASSGR